TWSVRSLWISYCGSSGLQRRMCPLYPVSRVCTLTMRPLTWPASEFQLTWSPTLNAWGMASLRAGRSIAADPVSTPRVSARAPQLQDRDQAGAEGGEHAGEDRLGPQPDLGEIDDRHVAAVEIRVAAGQRMLAFGVGEEGVVIGISYMSPVQDG